MESAVICSNASKIYPRIELLNYRPQQEYRAKSLLMGVRIINSLPLVQRTMTDILPTLTLSLSLSPSLSLQWGVKACMSSLLHPSTHTLTA